VPLRFMTYIITRVGRGLSDPRPLLATRIISSLQIQHQRKTNRHLTLNLTLNDILTLLGSL